jgi:hypothetical protein
VWNKERKEIEWLGEDELEEHIIQSKKNGYQKIHYELIGSGKSVLVGGVISKINMTVINHTYENINLQSYKDGHYQKATKVLPGKNIVKISSVDTIWKVWKVNLPAPRPCADVEWKIPFNHGNNLTYHIRYKNK